MKNERVQAASWQRRKVDPIERFFMIAHDWERVKSAGISYDETTRNLQMLEAFFVDALKERPEDALEIRRRIAESRLDLAITKKCSFAVCRARLNALSHLGFTNLDRKGFYHLIYARGIFDRGHKKMAKRIAVDIIEELENSLKKRKSRSLKQTLAAMKNFLDLFEKT
ncbi:MAG: hypothetical protein ABSD72_08600 [Terracidiphilus sp.]